jgi:phage terminase large subunit-like protein
MGPYRKLSPDAIPEVAEWLHIVEGGVIPVSKDNHQLCALVRKIFSEEELWLDRKRLDTYLGYQQYFPFKLNAPEKFMLALMLCVYMLPGIPRFETLFLYVGRGFGKNGFITFLVFCMLSKANGILEYDVHVAATTEDQAKTSFEELRNLLDRGKSKFENGFSWTKTEIKNKSTSSVFKFLTANAASKDGGRPGALILDEIHAYENSKLIAVLIGGLGKKDDARIFKITTDGDVREGPLDEEKEKAERILAQEIPDRRTLPMLFRLDDPEEIHDERMWPKANPAILERPNLLQRYREDYQDWLEHPQKHPEVPTKRFNCPQQRTDIMVTDWKNIEAASRDWGNIDGLSCVVGFDYARTTDMLGACILFHRDGEYQAICHAWWCTHSSDAGEVKAPLALWAELGWLTIVDDVSIDPALPCEWVRDFTYEHGNPIEFAAIDSYRVDLMKRALIEVLGLDPALTGKEQRVWLVRPSDQMRVHPIIDEAFANHRIAWGDNPVMRWCTNNAKLEPAPNENFKYGKIAPHSRKTDLFMAMVAAFAVADKIPDMDSLVFAEPFFFGGAA